MENNENKQSKIIVDHKDARIARLEKEIKFVKNQMANALSLYDEARQEADQAVKAKGEFMSKLSHEFRTPMNALIGYSDLLMKRDENEVTRRYASGIKSATNRLLNLFNDLIEVSRIESGITVCDHEEYDMGVLISSIMDSFSNEVAEKGLLMKLDFDEDLPTKLYGDFYHLRQIICNLLDNAVKYTEKGYVGIEIRAKRGGDLSENGRKKVMITFSVKDTGKGIRKQDKDKLFDVFEQFNKKNPYANQGVGIGLTVAKYYSNLMHGDISFESTYGEGSEFKCYVMQEIVDDTPISHNYTYDGNTHREIVFTSPSARVLIVDDSKVNLCVAKGLLEDYGINADTADGGLEAVKKVGRKNYDIIFMDHMMPDIDGIETMKRIRDKGNWCENVPIIALTANATDEAKQLFRLEGMQDFLAKPIELPILRDILLKWIPKEKIIFSDINEGYLLHQDKDETMMNTALTPSRLLDEDIHLEIGLSYLGGNLKAYKETLCNILKDCSKKVLLVGTYLEEGNLKNYAIEAHSVKSVSASIGATTFSELAKEHEFKAKEGDEVFIKENGPYFVKKYNEFLDSIERILEEERVYEEDMEKKAALKMENEDPKVEIGDDEIKEVVEQAIVYLKDYEPDEAEKILRSLMSLHEKIDLHEKLYKVQEFIDDFEYDEAVAILETII